MSTSSMRPMAMRDGGAAVTRFLAAAFAAAILLATAQVRADPLVIGNVYTFAGGTGSPTPWIDGDKAWTYIEQSGFTMTEPGGNETITITNGGPPLNDHTFLLTKPAPFFTTGTYMLGYTVQVPTGPFVFNTIGLDSLHLTNNTDVYKDVFSSLTLFNAGSSGPGTGDLAALQSSNGVATGDVSIFGYTQVWVRDWIQIDATGSLAGIDNIVTQAVPEIDLASFAGACPLLVAGLALLERRRRRPLAGGPTA